MNIEKPRPKVPVGDQAVYGYKDSKGRLRWSANVGPRKVADSGQSYGGRSALLNGAAATLTVLACDADVRKAAEPKMAKHGLRVSALHETAFTDTGRQLAYELVKGGLADYDIGDKFYLPDGTVWLCIGKGRGTRRKMNTGTKSKWFTAAQLDAQIDAGAVRLRVPLSTRNAAVAEAKRRAALIGGEAA